MGKINLLPTSVAELIAAGEVIDRPSSIVKELIENSLDASATRITVELRNGGITYLRVADNGCGIAPDEIPLAFVRHATSKIATADDLDAIMTLGFRGEALPSIAAVSRVSVTTRTAERTLGCRYSISAGQEEALEDAGCAVGTTFEIRDIFYNIPARMKFLKKDVTEGNAIASLLDRLALANPSVSFELIRDGKRTLQTPGDGNLRSVIRLVCGADVATAMIPVAYSQDGITVEGMISKPTVARSTRSLQTFFINSRFIRSRTCEGAVEEAYKNRLMTGRFPACVLNLKIDSALVDVNVHPAKLEVRFSSERTVYNAVYSACLAALSSGEKQALPKKRPVSSFDLTNFDYTDRQLNLSSHEGQALETVRTSAPIGLVSKTEESVDLLILNDDTAQRYSPTPHRIIENSSAPEPPVPILGRHYSVDIECEENPHFNAEKSSVKQNSITEEISAKEKAVGQKMDNLPPISKTATVIEEREEPRAVETPIPYQVLGELLDTYVLVEQADELLLIDKHAAHERSIYNRIRHLGEHGGEARQMLLVPRSVTLPKEEYRVLIENPQALESLGIIAEDFGEGTLLVREIPMLLLDVSPDELLEETARRVLSCKANLTPAALDELLYSVSCKAAVKAGRASGREELEQIAALVLTDKTVRHCPHGRPVLLQLSKREIGRMFGRLG